MLTGSIPKPVLQQLAKVVDLGAAREVFVCGSDRLRVEQLVTQASRSAAIHGSSTDLLACAVGAFAATGEVFSVRFRGDLEVLEDALAGAGARERVAAVMLAHEMAQYCAGRGASAQEHRRYYLTRVRELLASEGKRLDALCQTLRLADFTRTDFVEHARAGRERGALVIAFPTLVGNRGFGSARTFIERHVDWDAPEPFTFAEEDVDGWLADLDASGTAYVVGLDQARAGHLTPVAGYELPNGSTIYLYARSERSSFIRRESAAGPRPFAFELVDPAAVSVRSKVTIVEVDAGAIAFLEAQHPDRFPERQRGALDLAFLVYVDGKLAGGFVYDRTKPASTTSITLRTCFAMVPDLRIAQLVAILATAGEPVSIAGRRLLIRPDTVRTTVITTHGTSMRHRDIFGLVARGEGTLTYASHVRDEAVGVIFREWWERFGCNRGRDDADAADPDRPPASS